MTEHTELVERDLANLLANAMFAENLDEMPTKRDEYGPSWCQDDMLEAAREILSAGYEVRKVTRALTPSTPLEEKAVAWHLASMNDGLFIINAAPRPSTDDIWPDRPDGPTVVLNVTELPEAKAIKIVGVMNSLARHDNSALVEALKPFAEFASKTDVIPDDFVITKGSGLARRQDSGVGPRICKEAADEIERLSNQLAKAKGALSKIAVGALDAAAVNIAIDAINELKSEGDR